MIHSLSLKNFSLKLFNVGLFAQILFCAGNAKPLYVPEPLLEQALADSLGVDRTQLTRELVADKLEFFELNNAGIRDLRGLEVAKNLKVLVLKDNLIKDITPLVELANLRKLDLSGNRISSLLSLSGFSLEKMQKEIFEIQQKLSARLGSSEQSPEMILELSDLTERIKRGPWQLNELSLSNNRLLGLSGISNLAFLQHLDVSGNALIDLEGISSISNLVTLYAQGNQLGRAESYVDGNKNKAFDPGESFNDESGNGKRDTDPLMALSSLPKLSNLYLYENLLHSVRSLQNLPSLKILLLSGNKLKDIRNLGDFPSLERLALSDNRITSLEGLSSLTKIKYLYLVENLICDLRPIQSLTTLKELRLQRNQLVNIGPLSGLSSLQVLSLSNNFIYSLNPLLEMNILKRLSLSGNFVNLDDFGTKDAMRDLRIKGVSITVGSQKKRVISVENLILSLIGHPNLNHSLGEYLEANGYFRLVDFVEDSSISEDEKIIAYQTWYKALRNGKPVADLKFPGK